MSYIAPPPRTQPFPAELASSVSTPTDEGEQDLSLTAPFALPHPCLGPAIRAKSKLEFFAQLAGPRHGSNTASAEISIRRRGCCVVTHDSLSVGGALSGDCFSFRSECPHSLRIRETFPPLPPSPCVRLARSLCWLCVFSQGGPLGLARFASSRLAHGT